MVRDVFMSVSTIMIHAYHPTSLLQNHWLLIRPYLVPKNAPDGRELVYFYVWLWSICGIAGLHQASHFQWWPEFRIVLAEHDRAPQGFSPAIRTSEWNIFKEKMVPTKCK